MAIYACPMHPDVQSDRAINCSKCGMKLVLRQDDRATTGTKDHKKEHERK